MKNRFSIGNSLIALTLTILFSVTVQAQAFHPLRITGPVTVFRPADCGQNGSITIAGLTLRIAAGTDVGFADMVPAVGASGAIVDTIVRSAVWQVIGTVRQIDVYLDPQSRIRVQFATTQPLSPTAARPLDITGVVSAADASSVTINGLTFPIAPGSTSAAVADLNKVVRITGTLNSNNQLTGPVVNNSVTTTVTVSDTPYRKLSICTAPVFFGSLGGIFVRDHNSGDPAGPITGFVGPQYLCDQSLEAVTIDGGSTIPFAPNFTMRQDISQNTNACYELQIDQLGLITTGSRKISGKGNKVSGVLEAAVVQGFTGPFPTTRTEEQQRGSILISGVRFTIAAGNTVTLSGGPILGDQVCLRPLAVTAGSSVIPLPGELAPTRTGQLLNGSTLSKGSCP